MNIIYLSAGTPVGSNIWEPIRRGIRDPKGSIRLYFFIFDQRYDPPTSGATHHRHVKDGLDALRQLFAYPPSALGKPVGMNYTADRSVQVTRVERSIYTQPLFDAGDPTLLSGWSPAGYYDPHVPDQNRILELNRNAVLQMWGYGENKFYDPVTNTTTQGACVMVLLSADLFTEYKSNGGGASQAYEYNKGDMRQYIDLLLNTPEQGCSAPIPSFVAYPDHYKDHLDKLVISQPFSGDFEIESATIVANDIQSNFSAESASSPKVIDKVERSVEGVSDIEVGNDGQSEKGGTVKVGNSGNIIYTPGSITGEDRIFYQVCSENTVSYLVGEPPNQSVTSKSSTLCSISAITVFIGTPPDQSITLDGYVFNDNAFNDNSTTAPHNGLQEAGEEGLANRVVTLTNTDNPTETLSAVTDGRGYFSYTLPSEWKTKTISLTVKPTAGWQAISESIDGVSTQDSAGNEGVETTDSQFSGLLDQQTQFLFGQIKTSVIDGDKRYQYDHFEYFPFKLMVNSPSEVDFALDIINPTPAWTSTFYQDLNCDGKKEVGGDPELSSAQITTTTEQEEVCILIGVDVPQLINGKTPHFISTLQATVTPTDPVPTYHDVSETLTRQATIKYEFKKGELTLYKEVKGGDSTVFTTNNQAKPGEVLTYRMTYNNPSIYQIRDVVIKDSVPAFSKLNATVDCNGEHLTGACTLVTPAAADNKKGYEGLIHWEIGVLEAGEGGSVTYQIKLDD
ncbi:hypothetical protein L0B53_03500 [Vibrio sp. SS-MA-C1-2]|uniref:hypothetical protein n=1 Tax=Vibrio sp. SS-MA-C1-2 TaxID=2908646 RepID=UPI001F487205|nr:hypothetical protein [Vibrio sp. SS-MA-C1-2]UJF17016.1 hypothetical protein L0B53_03500 [Vibrio sp. SS-MA-C1-2]